MKLDVNLCSLSAEVEGDVYEGENTARTINGKETSVPYRNLLAEDLHPGLSGVPHRA